MIALEIIDDAAFAAPPTERAIGQHRWLATNLDGVVAAEAVAICERDFDNEVVNTAGGRRAEE